jgi:O-antigen ligase
MSISIRKIKIKNVFLFIVITFLVYKIISINVDISYISDIYDLLIKRFLGIINLIGGKSGDASSIEREALLKDGLEIFSNNPLFGIGLNNFRLLFGKYAHNNYLELFAGVGVIGTALFYNIYVLIFRQISKMNTFILKKYFFSMVFILLVMDLATVSYFNKLVLFTLLYIYYVAKINTKNHNYTFDDES